MNDDGSHINKDINNGIQEIIIMEPKIYDKLIEEKSKNNNKIDNLINDLINKDQNKNSSFINKKKDTVYIAGKKDKKIEYFDNFKIFKNSEFNSLHNFLNNTATYNSNKVIFENDKIDDIIIQIYYDQYELCHCGEDNVYSCKFLFYFYEDKDGKKDKKNREDKYLKKLLYYKSFKTFLIVEKYKIKVISENDIHLTKSDKKVGRIYIIDKNYKDIFNDKNVDKNLLVKNYKENMLNKLIEILNK